MKRLLAGILLSCLVLGLAPLAAQAAGSQESGFTVGGRMLTDIGWWHRSKELTANQKSDVGSSFVNVPGFSYLRVTWRAADGQSGALAEMSLKSLQPSASVGLRYAYGWHQAGSLRLLAGRTDNWFGNIAYHPRQYLGLNENNHAYLWGWGYLWPDRVAQVQATWQNDDFGLQLALEDPRNKSSAQGEDFHMNLPRISLTGMIKAGAFQTHPGVIFVQRRFHATDDNPDPDFNTWALNVPMMLSLGGFTLKAQLHYGVNFYDEFPFYPVQSAPVRKKGGDLEDTTVLGGYITAEQKVGRCLLIAGFGYERYENDAWRESGFKDDQTDTKAVFLAASYQVNPFFKVHPEFSWYDYGDSVVNGNDQGREWLLGLHFSFVF